ASKHELQMQDILFEYYDAMTPLIDAFQSAKDLNVPGVKREAGQVQERLQGAQASLEDFSKLLSRRLTEMEDFQALIDLLDQTEKPATVDEVKKSRREYQNTIQGLRNAEQRSKEQLAKINKQCQDSQKAVESTIKVMVTSVVAWRHTKEIREGTEWA